MQEPSQAVKGTRHGLSLVRLLIIRHSWTVIALASIGLITVGLWLLAWRVSGDETVAIGTEADRIYIADGFYEPERSAEHGIYRWTQPLAQITLPDWGPGRLHVEVSGVGVTQGEAVLKIGGAPLDHIAIKAGQVWSVQAWGVTASRNPTVTLEARAFNPPGDSRTLGLLVKSMQIYTPDARARAWLNIGLLGLTGVLLYFLLSVSTGRGGLATIAGAAVPALYGPLAAYRDPWMDTVAWVAPIILAALLFLSWRRYSALRIPYSVFRISRTPVIIPKSKIQNPKSKIQNPKSAFALLALTAALMLLYLGYMNAFDSDRMYQVTAGIAEYGRPTRYPGYDIWTKYGFGQPLIAVPFYLLGKVGVLLGGAYGPVTRLAVSFTNLAVTSLTCLLLYRAGRRFASVGVAVAVVATYLLTTPALNYARTFFSEPAGGLLLLAGLLLIIPQSREESLKVGRVLWAGACLGAMILFKPAFAVYLPAPGLAVLWLAVTREMRNEKSEVRRLGVGLRSLLSVLRYGLVFSIGPLVALAVQGLYNYIRYAPLPDAVFRNGYEKEAGFSTPLLEGLGGLLFSPGKSVFLYAPVLLLMPIGLWLMYRSGGRIGKITVALIVVESAAGFVFNALWWAWTGNFAWGPRLIMPVLPLLVWPLASVGQFAVGALREAGGVKALARILVGGWIALAALGALVSIAGAMVDFQVYYRSYGLLLAGDPGEAVTIYDPSQSPLLVEPGYLLNGLTAAIHRPSLASTGMPAIWDVLAPAALVLVAATAAWLATLRSEE